MEKFLTIFVLLLAGLGLQRVREFPENGAHSLNLFVVYVSLPALILHQLHKLTFSTELLVPVIMPWFMLIISALLVLAITTLFKWDRKTTGALLLVVPLANTSFLGIPMVEAFFGVDAVSYAVLYDQLGSFLGLATYGSFILAVYASSEKPKISAIVKRIFLFPPFIALAVALATMRFSYPEPLDRMFGIIAASLVPAVMVAVGLQLQLKLEARYVGPFTAGLLLKLVAAPLIALAAVRMLGFDSVVAQVCVFEAGMPPMVTAGALALAAGLAPKLTAALVGYGIIVSFATLPVLYQLL